MNLKLKTNLDVNKIHLHYLGNEFKKVFGQKKIADIGWFQPLKIKKIKKSKITIKEIKTDNIKSIINYFIPEEKYGPLLVNIKLKSLGYKINYDAEADYFNEKLGLIFEFDGNHHYMEPFKYQNDERKKNCLRSIEFNGKPKRIKIIRIPYYYSFTKDVAEYIFGKLIKYYRKNGHPNLPAEGFYTNEKYLKAISKIHKNMFTGKPAASDKEVPACGIHESRFAPAGYCSKGIEKLLDDFKKEGDLAPPKSIEHQYMWCLKYWLDDITEVNGDRRSWLILPEWHDEFMQRYNYNINNKKEEYLQHVFAREYYSIERTKNI